MIYYIVNSVLSFLIYIYYFFMGKREANILMIGLNYSGKSTILYRLKIGEFVSTIPTIGFNIETIKFGSKRCVIYDVGGQEKLVGLWKHYYGEIDALIYVIDSSDRDRLDHVKTQLNSIRDQKELYQKSFLILAHKQDQCNAMTTAELVSYLELNKITERKWHIQSTSALNGKGLYEGLLWLHNNIF